MNTSYNKLPRSTFKENYFALANMLKNCDCEFPMQLQEFDFFDDAYVLFFTCPICNSEKLLSSNTIPRSWWIVKNGGKHTQEQWMALVEKVEGHCVRCRNMVGFDRLTKDHIVPVSRGGSNDITNLQPLCLPCNISKNNRESKNYLISFINDMIVSPRQET